MKELPVLKTAAMKLVLAIFICVSTCALAANTPKPDGTEVSVVEGTLIQVSKLPQADRNPYPDCNFTAVLEIQRITAGKSIPKKVILVLPGFVARQYTSEAGFKTGDLVRATIVPFASMPDRIKQTQQADEVEDVDLEFFFARPIVKISAFQPVKEKLSFTDRRDSSDQIVSEIKDPAAATERLRQMREDLRHINEELTKHGGDWDYWYESLNRFRAQYKKKYDEKAQLWVGDSYFSAGQNEYGKGYSRDFVSSLVAFNKYLKDRNVDLIVVRVPQKGEIVDDLFTDAPTDQISNPYLLRLYKELLDADVEVVVDEVPRLKKARMSFPLMYYYQDFTEEHPAEGAAWVIAEMISERLQRYDSIRKSPKVPLKREKVSLQTGGFKWPAGNSKFKPTEPVTFYSISSDQLPLLKQGNNSPVLVVGSSFIGSPSFERGGNIPAYMAYQTGVIPDVLYREGSNATIPRTIAREGDAFLKHRSVCVFPLVPWAIHLPLDLPPLVNPATKGKVLLSSHSGNDLRKIIRFAEGTAANVFRYTSDGSLTVHSRSKDTRAAGDFTVELPEAITRFPYFMISIETTTKDAAAIKVTYAKQNDHVHKSYTQTNLEEFFVFRSEVASGNAVFSIGNIRPDTPMTIRSIQIYGLK
ncbi:hypothetical protein M1B72_05095 [Geomonas paludis]|uniref:AlgX/AlgJ SGNH hydrolase-like domain-containing protein n=1 Tax=Geomonas paludis TaxID=2740185 RepID=A0A6V8MX66_9BACT|nr:hypothetical protein [Geomonas paludis]UPU37087.1 hypothetical protein M1B72_05095 [Geomonas paludis]GFO64816.1 hypothetical protein GMPD_27350 [Geomonas paludis]